MADKKAKAPSGLGIQRKGSKYIFKWKRGATYTAQELYYAIKKSDWTKMSEIAVTSGAASKSKTLSKDDYFPNKYASGEKAGKYKPHLKAIKFKVRGRQLIDNKRIWSAWKSEKKVLEPPKAPKLALALSSSLDNVCIATVTPHVKDDDARPFTHIEYQSVLMPGNAKPSYKSSQAGWQTGTRASTSAWTLNITDASATLAKGPHTRYFRVRARGPAGSSAWVEKSHVYAKPFAATNLTAVAQTIATGYTVTAKWKTNRNASHPADSIVCKYRIDEPEAGMSCPADDNWTIGGTIKQAKQGASACVFGVNGTIGEDQCLFVMITTKHDHGTNDTNSKPVLATGGIGKLRSPSGLSVKADDETHKLTVKVENNSVISDAHLAVVYTHASKPTDKPIIGVIPHPDSSGEQEVILQAPDWTGESAYGVEVYAFVGKYTSKARADGVRVYTIKKVQAKSDTLKYGGAVPSAPENVAVDAADTPETARITWDWTWQKADSAEISWADHADAWESTDEPETYIISHMHAAAWNIAGLEAGVRWYFRVRLLSGRGDDITAGPWSEMKDIVLSTVPIKPSLELSARVTQPGNSITASWAYVSTDGTTQDAAEISRVTLSATGEVEGYSDPIERVASESQCSLTDEWQADTSYAYAVRVRSASGRWSDWSDPATLVIADPISAAMTIDRGSDTVTVTDDDGDTRQAFSIVSLPLYVTVTGAGAGGRTTLAIERAADHHVERPDESDFDGYAGETVFLHTQTGEDTIVVDVPDLIGALDDGALYRLVADVEDTYGQTARVDQVTGVDTDIVEVHWGHQALKPTATATVDGLTVSITATAPEGVEDGDVVDIYRLSADRPELIVEGGAFGRTYIDPYPAIGENGGHRVVMRTGCGDYITEENEFAWIDLGAEDGDILETDKTIIDFDGEQIELYYNVGHSDGWEKSFKQTVYLGGSVRGDWNPGIKRTGEVTAATITVLEEETIRKLRRLAAYNGICHIRTQDGSSYPCDIQVSSTAGRKEAVTSYTLKITRVDPEALEGFTV
jgi:hypothetical protein